MKKKEFVMSINQNLQSTKQPNITFAIIKSDAIRNNVVQNIFKDIKEAGFSIIYGDPTIQINAKMSQVIKFYYEHIGRPYFSDLSKSLTMGSVPLILEYQGSESAITKFRTLIGATNSREASPWTIRGKYGGHLFNPDAPIAENAIHASDSLESVIREIKIMSPHIKTINSLVCGEFKLDDFKINKREFPKKIKILQSDYEIFLSLIKEGKLPSQKLGRQFYDYFKLYESILKDNSHLHVLCNKDGDEARHLILNYVEFI